LAQYQGWSNYILDGARETLVLLRVVVLEADLEVNGLQKLPLLVLDRFLFQFKQYHKQP
jgi:hypothetical protein